MKLIALLLLLGALALPSSASFSNSWTQIDVPGHNLTLNFTSQFDIVKNDTLRIVIKNVGNESLNDTITINEINVSDASKAEGRWTGHEIIAPNSSETINFPLNITTDDAVTVDIRIYYNVSSDYKILSVTAYYPGTPELTSQGNSKTNNNSAILTVNISEVVTFNATADQTINTWNWFKDNIKQSNNYDNFSTSWGDSGTKNLKVNATNANGTSNTVAWTVIVQAPARLPAPSIISWSNNKTNNNSATLIVNISEVVTFNATADQTISTWNWFKDNVRQSNNYDNFSTSWGDSGTKNLKVNATNANGTSNTVAWTVIVQATSGSPTPSIISWSNNKTNNNNLTLSVNASETVKFNFTANQTLTSWLWTLNGNALTNPSDNLIFTFDDEGFYKVAAKGSNANGTTQTIVWNVTVPEKEGNKSVSILSWSPQVVDYVYVNDTVNETIEYSITTVAPMMVNNWSVDGVPVAGTVSDNTYSYTRTWDNKSIGFHTVIYKGNNTSSQIEFRWYVNVYEIGGYRGGNLFDIIDDALENQITDIKIRMFKYRIAKDGGNSAIVAQKVNQLHDEIAKRQMTREALRKELKAGNITMKEYVAALKQAQRDVEYNMKFAKGMAKIAKEDLKDDNSSREFEKISETENEWSKDKKKDDVKKEDAGTKGKSNKKDKVKENKNNGKSKGHGGD